MRLRPRPHPMLKIDMRCRLYGRYDEVEGTIIFGKQCKNEEDVIGTLIHELQHWTTWMWLTRKEINQSNMPDYNKNYDKYACWIPEKLSLMIEELVASRH